MEEDVRNYYVMISDFGTESCLKIYLNRQEFESLNLSVFIEKGYMLTIIKELDKHV